MADEIVLLKKRFEELANKTYRNNLYTFTNFLTMAEQDCFYQIQKEISYVPYTMFGGTEDCERLMIRFGSEELCGYEEPFPICCILIEPLIRKFADELSHRDFLGALMNLGIERNLLGDIIIKENKGYLFCQEKMSSFIVDNLDKIKHTSVKCSITEDVPETTATKIQEMTLVVSSERCDGVIAKVFQLSRSQCVDLFREKKIYVNGRLYENNSGILKTDDKVSVRGYGKFEYCGMQHETRKGRISMKVRKYI